MAKQKPGPIENADKSLVRIECAQCHQEFFKTGARLEADRGYRCPICRRKTALDDEEVRNILAKHINDVNGIFASFLRKRPE